MPPEPEHSFIDSNVIANWIVLTNQLKKVKNKGNFLKSEKEEHPKLYYSYTLIEKILNRKTDDKHKFYYCSLVLTEVFNVLFEMHVAEHMIDNYISLNDWHKERQKKFPEGTYKKIFENNEKKFKALEKKLSYSDGDLSLMEIAGVFISEFGCLTHDAYILANAILSDCTHLITCDERLQDKLKEAKQIKLIKPSTFLTQKNI